MDRPAFRLLTVRKRPVTVHAMLNTPEAADACMDWVRDGGWSCWRYDEDDGFPDGTWHMDTPEGGHDASPGDYIIRGVKGEFYPCKPDIFALTYDIVERGA